MMKAKDMAARYLADRTPENAAKIAYDLVMETSAIATARHCQSNSAMTAVLRECDDKWRAFCRLVSSDEFGCTVNTNGFKLVLHKLVPLAVELFP